jgi:hypothetical protein
MRLSLYLEGNLTGFYKHLYDAIIASDRKNLERLRLSFPNEVQEIENFRS